MSTYIRLLFIPITTLLSLAIMLDSPTHATPLDVGDPLPRINCTAAYEATIFAENLGGSDGLALDPVSGDIFVAEESNGRVSRVPAAGGVATPVVSGLVNPEGIAFDTTGNLYVVEDTADGRLIRYDTGGITTTLAISLTYPEGVTVGSDGQIYITESELETLSADSTEEEVRNLESRISSISPTAPYTLTSLIVITPTIVEDLPSLSATGTFTSFAGITQGNDGLLYVSNELSGVEIITTTAVPNPLFPIGPPTIDVTLMFTSTDSILAIDPQAPELTLINADLTTPEGVRFDTNGDFPLYVAEEDISAEEGLNTGRLSLITNAGTAETVCTGFLAIEDVLLLEDGSILVSEDTSGYIIALTPSEADYLIYLPFLGKE